MNVARESHSSCFIRNKAFVFGGWNQKQNLLDLDTIEMTEVDFYRSQQGIPELTGWYWSRIDLIGFKPRAQSVTCVINPRSILVLGGSSMRENADFSDGYILDVDTMEIEKTVNISHALKSRSN